MRDQKIPTNSMVKVINGNVRKGEVGQVMGMEYVSVLGEWLYRVRFNDRDGLVAEKDLKVV